MDPNRTAAPIRRPHPCLQSFVEPYVGYDITGSAPGTHRGLPSGTLTFIVAIDEPLRQYDEECEQTEQFDVLLAGLHLHPTLIPHSGAMRGIQIGFSPFAPRALFGLPAVEFAHRSYSLRDIVPPVAVELHERVNAASDWPSRFDAIDDVLSRTLKEHAAPKPELAESWRRIATSHGGLPVSLIADSVGWSRRYLQAQFQSEFGIGPKDAARMQRFDRARKMIALGPQSIAEVATACGYADQSHLNREFRRFAGLSPTQWLQSDEVARAFRPAKPDGGAMME